LVDALAAAGITQPTEIQVRTGDIMGMHSCSCLHYECYLCMCL
jgi:hypothetical protein